MLLSGLRAVLRGFPPSWAMEGRKEPEIDNFWWVPKEQYKSASILLLDTHLTALNAAIFGI